MLCTRATRAVLVYECCNAFVNVDDVKLGQALRTAYLLCIQFGMTKIVNNELASFSLLISYLFSSSLVNSFLLVISILNHACWRLSTIMLAKIILQSHMLPHILIPNQSPASVNLNLIRIGNFCVSVSSSSLNFLNPPMKQSDAIITCAKLVYPCLDSP